MTLRPTHRQKGAGMIEVLITVLILGTSLLALGALQNRALHFNHSAYLRSQANVLAYDILDRMRINRGQLASYEIELSGTDDAPESPSNLPERDLSEWLTAVDTTLPGGEGAIECDADNLCTVTLRWVDRDSPPEAPEEGGGEEGEPEEETTTFTYSTRI